MNYNYYTQSQMRQQQPQPQTYAYVGLKGRPVSSLEEARVQSIDFDGSIFYFPDIANKRIYTKQINLDGTASLNMYELKEIPVPVVQSNVDYITREEFESAIEQIKNSLENAVVASVPPQIQNPELISQPVSSGQAPTANSNFNF